MPNEVLKVPGTTDSSGEITVYTLPIASRWITKIDFDKGTLTGTSALVNITDEVTGLNLFTQSSGVSDALGVVRLPLHTVATATISGAYSALRTPSRLKIRIEGASEDETFEVQVYVQSTPPVVL